MCSVGNSNYCRFLLDVFSVSFLIITMIYIIKTKIVEYLKKCKVHDIT